MLLQDLLLGLLLLTVYGQRISKLEVLEMLKLRHWQAVPFTLDVAADDAGDNVVCTDCSPSNSFLDAEHTVHI